MVDVSRIELHELRPSDVIIATVANATAAGADRVRQHLERKFPGHPIVVKSDQVDITFAREELSCDECGTEDFEAADRRAIAYYAGAADARNDRPRAVDRADTSMLGDAYTRGYDATARKAALA